MCRTTLSASRRTTPPSRSTARHAQGPRTGEVGGMLGVVLAQAQDGSRLTQPGEGIGLQQRLYEGASRWAELPRLLQTRLWCGAEECLPSRRIVLQLGRPPVRAAQM